MLTELKIENFAILQSLDLELDPGLVIFTGETGAGKSIILDAFEFVLGSRSESTFLRLGTERANVEATFHLSPQEKEAIDPILKREDLADDDNSDYLLLGRELRREGRNTARVNGHLVTVGILREIGALLVDIHGQSEHLSLLDVHHHLELLDRYAGTEVQVSAFSEIYHRLQDIRRQKKEAQKAERDADRRIDFLTYQIKEIESAHLKAGEEEDLRNDRNRLANSENLASLAQSALQLIDESSPEAQSITESLGQASHVLSNLARIDPSKSGLVDQIQASMESLTDLAGELRAYLEQIEYNPKRLEQIEDRLDLIHNLKRKYGKDIAAILAFATDAKSQLEAMTHNQERLAELEKNETSLLEQLSGQGIALSQKRKAAADSMSRAIEQQLNELRMGGAQFTVEFQTRDDPEGVLLENGQRVAFHANGIDTVEFLIAPNPGEGFKPLARIASGGETSRLMLSIKNVLAQADPIPTLVFDEIDQGIGGRVGLVVGEKLWRLAQTHQVFCITHLPQLAVFGGQHFRVSKEVKEDRTGVKVENLNGEVRLRELALMMGEISEGTLKSADEMLNKVQEITGRTTKP